MNSFLKTNSTWLSLLGLAVIIVFLAFIFRPKSPEYQISAVKALKLMNDQSMTVAVKDIAGKQLIDIRPINLFEQGHAANAINIPIRMLLDKKSIELFDELLENGKDAIFYGSDELQATAPWLLLQQLGYKNLKLLKGGLDANGEFIETALPSTEVSVIDPTAFQAKPQGITTPESKVEKKKPETIVPVKKAVTSGGGC
jgi:rhodanese-related sulfurtransferase